MITIQEQSNHGFASVRESRGFVRNELLSGRKSVDQIHDPPNEYRLIDLMYRNDPVIHTAFTVLVEMMTRNGYTFIPRTEDKKRIIVEKNKLIDTFEEINFDESQDNWLLGWLKYGDAFIELRKNGKSYVNELWTLETTEMRIAYDEHGKILAYVQRPFNLTGLSLSEVADKEKQSGIWFDPEEVIHLRLIWDGSSVYSLTPLEPIARSWSAKQNALSYLDKILINLPPELLIHLKGANKMQKDSFLESLYRRRSNPGVPITSYGGENSAIQVEKIAFELNNGILPVLEYLREEVLMITRVPAIWVGMADNNGANARNSEAQIFSLETHVSKLQQKAENYYNRYLLPRLGFKDWLFKFNPVTLRSEKDVIQNAAVFRSMQMKPEAIIRYMRRNGINDFEPDDLIDLTEQSMDGDTPANGASNQTATNQTAQSRQKKMGMKDLTREGTSEDSAKKMSEQRRGMN